VPEYRVKLKKEIKRRIAFGHPWIYENEIAIEPSCENGSLVKVFTYSGQFVGKGYYNRNSLIRVRLLTRKNVNIDRKFFKDKIQRAYSLRTRWLKEKGAFRLIYSEADGLPGLIVDKFADFFVVQISTLGMSKFKETIVNVLIELFNPKGIYEKTEGSFIAKEGIEPYSGWLYGNGPNLIPFKLHEITFLADLHGQKTGFFLDQRFNAENLSEFSTDRRVLDLFSYTGNFAFHLLKGGAREAILVDYSERALAVAEEIARINSFKEKIRTINANSFDFIRNVKIGEFELIVIDPPAMLKSATAKHNALRAYKELNLRAIRSLKDGGILATSSCTQLIRESEWLEKITEAFKDSKKIGKLLFSAGQPFDHPALTSMHESNYLKFRSYIVSSVSEF